MKKVFILVSFLMVAGVITKAVQWHSKAPRRPSRDNFTLIRDIPSPEINLIALGDMGTGGPEQRLVGQWMEAVCQDFGVDGVIFLGDNIYPHGVSSVDDPQWPGKVLVPYDLPCLRDVPRYPVLGNHDYEGNPQAQIDMDRRIPIWTFPNRFYSVELSPFLSFTGIDSVVLDFCFSPELCTIDFLQQQIGLFKDRIHLVAGHHPIKTSSSRGPTHKGGARGKVLGWLLCNEGAIYLSGHAHHLEYRYDPSCDQHMIVAGAGGADIYDGVKEPEVDFFSSTLGFAFLRINADRMVVSFYTGKRKKAYSKVLNLCKDRLERDRKMANSAPVIN